MHNVRIAEGRWLFALLVVTGIGAAPRKVGQPAGERAGACEIDGPAAWSTMRACRGLVPLHPPVRIDRMRKKTA